MENLHYNDWLPEEGNTDIRNYGIAFFKKLCRMMDSFKIHDKTALGIEKCMIQTNIKHRPG